MLHEWTPGLRARDALFADYDGDIVADNPDDFVGFIPEADPESRVAEISHLGHLSNWQEDPERIYSFAPSSPDVDGGAGSVAAFSAPPCSLFMRLIASSTFANRICFLSASSSLPTGLAAKVCL